MATVVSSPRGPRTVIARHCTPEWLTESDGDRNGSHIVVGGQLRFGVTVVDRHPDGAVGTDAAHVEIRRRPRRVGSLHRSCRQSGAEPGPSCGTRRATSRPPGCSRVCRRIVVTAMPDASRPHATSTRVAATSPTLSGMPRPLSAPTLPLFSRVSAGSCAALRAKRFIAARAERSRRRAMCAEGASRRCRSCGAGTRRRTRRR